MNIFECIVIVVLILVVGLCVLMYIMGKFGLLNDEDKKKDNTKKPVRKTSVGRPRKTDSIAKNVGSYKRSYATNRTIERRKTKNNEEIKGSKL